MRIVAGRHRGRHLSAPGADDRSIRPTSDRLRESVFDRLAHRFDAPVTGAAVIDLFAGTGALGFALVNARTVREAMRTLARYMPLVSSMRVSRYVEDDAAGALVWQYPIGPSAPRLQYISWGVAKGRSPER